MMRPNRFTTMLMFCSDRPLQPQFFMCAHSVRPNRNTAVAHQDGAGALKETAISFSVAVAIVTACFCTAMSCAAMCIKCCTWLFGHRGRRRLRRIPLRSSRTDEELTVGSEQTLVPTPIAQDDDDDAGQQQQQQQQKRASRKSEIELREAEYQRIGEQGEGGGANGASGGSATPRTRLSDGAVSASPGSPPHEQEEGEEKACGDGELL